MHIMELIVTFCSVLNVPKKETKYVLYMHYI